MQCHERHEERQPGIQSKDNLGRRSYARALCLMKCAFQLRQLEHDVHTNYKKNTVGYDVCIQHKVVQRHLSRIGRPYRDAQDRLLWKDKTCPAHT